MENTIIVCTDGILGGSPRLNGRRLNVGHVVWGITEDFDNMQTYKNHFEVSNEQISHAIMYCKEKSCLEDKPSRACNDCSLKFENDAKTWEEYQQMHDIGILQEEINDFKEDFEGKNTWEQAEKAFYQYQNELNLPENYQSLIENIL